MKREVNWCLVERVCVRQTDGAETRPCVRDLGTEERRQRWMDTQNGGEREQRLMEGGTSRETEGDE